MNTYWGSVNPWERWYFVKHLPCSPEGDLGILVGYDKELYDRGIMGTITTTHLRETYQIAINQLDTQNSDGGSSADSSRICSGKHTKMLTCTTWLYPVGRSDILAFVFSSGQFLQRIRLVDHLPTQHVSTRSRLCPSSPVLWQEIGSDWFSRRSAGPIHALGHKNRHSTYFCGPAPRFSLAISAPGGGVRTPRSGGFSWILRISSILDVYII